MSLADRRILFAPAHYYIGDDVGGSEYGWPYELIGELAPRFRSVEVVLGELRNGSFGPNVRLHQVYPFERQRLYRLPTLLTFLLRYSMAARAVASRMRPHVVHHVMPWSEVTFNPLILARGLPFALDRRVRVVVGPVRGMHSVDFAEDYTPAVIQRRFGTADRSWESRGSHGLPSPLLALARRLSLATLNRADGVVAITQEVKKKLIASGVRSRIEVIPTGVDLVRFHPNGALGRGGPLLVICPGYLQLRKGIDLVLEAFAAITARGVDARLVLVGDGPQRAAVEDRVRALRLGDRVELAGFVDHSAMASRYASADVMVTMSWSELLPRVVMESMASGLACVSAANTGARALIEHERSGLLVPLGDAGALARSLERLASEPLVRAALGRAARERIEAAFSWSAVGDKYERLYETLLSGESGARAEIRAGSQGG